MGVYDKHYLWPHHIYWLHIAFTYRILEELTPLAFWAAGTKIAPVARAEENYFDVIEIDTGEKNDDH